MRFPPPLLSVLCKCFPLPVLFASVPLFQSQQVRTVSPEQTLLYFSTETETGYGYFIQAKVWLCFLEYCCNKITIAAGRCCHRFLIRLKVQNVNILWNHTLEFSCLNFYPMQVFMQWCCQVYFNVIWPLYLRWQCLLHLYFDMFIHPCCCFSIVCCFMIWPEDSDFN